MGAGGGGTNLELDRPEPAKEEPLEGHAEEETRADGQVAEDLSTRTHGFVSGTPSGEGVRQGKPEGGPTMSAPFDFASPTPTAKPLVLVALAWRTTAAAAAAEESV